MKSKIQNPRSIQGLILAAGASERMGTPKALLRFGDGSTLLEHQTNLLRSAGIGEVAVVVGAHADEIRAASLNLNVKWIINDVWELGQFSSVQAGIRTVLKRDANGILILPVDAAGIKADTVRNVIDSWGDGIAHDAVIPEYRGRGGHPIIIATSLVQRIAAMNPKDKGSRLDLIIKSSARTLHLSVEDERVAENINTPAQWNDFIAHC